jgi:hypothetical protein
MKIKVNSRGGNKKYEYHYKIIYTDDETHKRIKDFSFIKGVKITDGIKQLLDFYEKKSECLCQKREA